MTLFWNILEIVVVVLIFVRFKTLQNEIDYLRSKVNTLNGIVKILQARNGMRADGADKH